MSSAIGIRTVAEPARLRKLRASPFYGSGRRLGTAGRCALSPCAGGDRERGYAFVGHVSDHSPIGNGIAEMPVTPPPA